MSAFCEQERERHSCFSLFAERRHWLLATFAGPLPPLLYLIASLLLLLLVANAGTLVVLIRQSRAGR